ncbi:cytochrome P450 [Colletotrichum gloeosporioides Cg-14]|uniref:Cytochrome P450 n=1 Tax=Colletotrichum gloeosporioides (strain Cg-14) TaxID=1237896 RepID=T0KKR1_COLGC|nr:cytochrome P450 [Colletotrichum gloeosporioides Cg-14]
MIMVIPRGEKATVEKARKKGIKRQKSVGEHNVFSKFPYQLLFLDAPAKNDAMIAVLLSFALILIIFEPLITYLRDKKRLRGFPNATYFSGISNIPFMILRYRGFRSREVHRAHQQHPVLRLGPNTVSFSSPAAIRAIYGHATPCAKGGSYENTLTPHAGLIEVIDKQDHAAKRRILSNAFATRNLEQWEFKVADKVRRLARQFDHACAEEGAAAVVDFRKWANLFTVEAIVDIALSQRLGCLERGDDLVRITLSGGDEKTVPFVEGLHAPRRALSMIVWSPWCRRVKPVLESISGLFSTGRHLGEDFNELLECLVRERVRKHEAGEELDDLATCLFQDKAGQARNLQFAEIQGQMSTLLDAGSDTTAIALTHVMYFLLKNPDMFTRLREEIDLHAAIDTDGVATYASVKNLPYLRACLDESLRLFPPVCTGLHRVTPPEGYEIDGHWIAGGTVVAVPIYTAHRNPAFFPEPERYAPERWLSDKAKDAQASFMPFSAGARGCIGRNITYIEQMMLLASLVRRYDFGFDDEGFELAHEEAFNLWPGSMRLRIQRRLV